MATDRSANQQHQKRGCLCLLRPDCHPHAAKEWGGGAPDICADHDHGPLVDWQAVASDLAPDTLAEWEAVIARHIIREVP